MTTQLRTLAVVSACVWLTACVATTPNYDAGFSDSVRIAQARQMFDPGATARNASKDATGIDGRAARASYDRYLMTFMRPEPQPNVFTIGIGAGNGSK